MEFYTNICVRIWSAMSESSPTFTYQIKLNRVNESRKSVCSLGIGSVTPQCFGPDAGVSARSV